ncbi:helix-turn-helix domain-containing protein [Clostridium sp. AUH-JLR23]
MSKRKAAKMLNTNHNTFTNWIKRYEKNNRKY